MTKKRSDEWDEVFSLLSELSELTLLAKRVEDRGLEDALARHGGRVKRLETLADRLATSNEHTAKLLAEREAEVAALRQEIQHTHKEVADAKGQLAMVRGGVCPPPM